MILNAGLKKVALPLPFFNLLYHLSRIGVYVLLGALMGTLGSLVGLGTQFTTAAGMLSLGLGTIVIVLGLGYTGWLPTVLLKNPASGVGGWISSGMSAAIRRGGVLGVVSLGALNGLLPCGLVYSALLAVAASGGALPGAAGMFAFGVGTIPALFVLGLGAGTLSARVRLTFSKLAGLLIIGVGMQLLLRGAGGLGWIPHQHLGKLMLW